MKKKINIFFFFKIFNGPALVFKPCFLFWFWVFFPHNMEYCVLSQKFSMTLKPKYDLFCLKFYS